MSTRTGHPYVRAILDITRETGYAPTPEELADVFSVTVRSLHSTLTPYKRDGTVTVNEDGKLIVRDE